MSLFGFLARIGPIRRAIFWVSGRFGVRRKNGAPTAPWIERRADRPFVVLLYHRVNDERARFFTGTLPERFERDLESMLEQGPALSLGEILERAARRDVPPGAWALTFDDGYRDNYTHALPILQRFGVPATVFLATGPVDSRATLWHDRVFDAFTAAPGAVVELDGARYDLGEPGGRARALQAFLGEIRRLAPPARDVRIAELMALLGTVEAPHPDRMIRWEEARAMAGQGVEFGGHTVTHPILSRMPLEEAANEIAACRARIEERLGVAPRFFAYPNGTRQDWNEDVVRAVREAGYDGAVTTEWGANDRTTDRYLLRRVGLWQPDPARAAVGVAWTRFTT